MEIQLFGVQSTGLYKNLMPGLIRKADKFGLDAGAVAGTDALNGTVKQRAFVQVGPDNLMGFFVGVGEVAYSPVVNFSSGGEGKGFRHVISRLKLHFREVHTPPVDAWRRPGFEPAHGQAHGLETIRQPNGRMHPVRTGGYDAAAGDGGAVQIGTSGQNDGFGFVVCSQLGLKAGDDPICYQELCNHSLLQI